MRTLSILTVLFLNSTMVFSQAMTCTLQNGQNGPGGYAYTGGEDTYITSGRKAEMTPGGAPVLRVGHEGGDTSRSLIRFNLSDITGRWTDDSRITGARMTLHLSEIEGESVRDTQINLYKISAANKTWAAGNLEGDNMSGSGFACWKWLAYDDTNYAMSHPKAQGFDIDVPRRFPWAGDKKVFEKLWPDLSNFKSSGCGVAGTDYAARPVAAARVSSSRLGDRVTLTFSDPSFVERWIRTPEDNAGFLLAGEELEKGGKTSHSVLVFASCENPSSLRRPALELDITNLDTSGNRIDYKMPYNGKVSISIFDHLGAEVRKLALSSPRRAGEVQEIWDGKTDAINWGESVRTVPDGDYTVKILAHQGLHAEYLVNIGMTFPVWEGAPGGYTGPPRGLALDGTAAVFVPSKGYWWSEGAQQGGFKMKPDGTRLVSYERRPFSLIYTAAMAYDKGKVYYYGKGGVYMKPDPDNPENTNVVNIVEEGDQEWTEGVTVNAADIAVYDGVLVMSIEKDRKLQWRDGDSGKLRYEITLSATPFGVAIDNQGRALVIVDDQVLAYTEGNDDPETIVSGGLDGAYRVGINRTNDEIYVAEGGAVYIGRGPYPLIEQYATSKTWHGARPLSASGQQIKRFSSEGKLLQTYGKKGGRPQWGQYDPTIGFRLISELEVAPDGSFWITEDGSWNARTTPASVRHYAADGKLIKDFIFGTDFCPDGRPDPDDLSIVWVPAAKAKGFLRCKVDWVNRTFKVTGCYNNYFPPMPSNHITNAEWYLVKHNGKTYFHVNGLVSYFDEQDDTIYPVARYGASPLHGWTVRKVRHEPWKTRFAEMGKTLDGWVDDHPYLWWDKNGNQSYMDKDEWISTTSYNRRLVSKWSWVDSEGTLYGKTLVPPVWNDVRDYEIPSYDFDSMQWMSPYVDEIFRAGHYFVSRHRPFMGLDPYVYCPGRQMWLYPKARGQKPNTRTPKVVSPGGMLFKTATPIVRPDKEGNLFEIYLGDWRKDQASKMQQEYPEGDAGFDSWKDIKRVQRQNLIIKRDKRGNPVSSVRIPFASGPNPGPGEISYFVTNGGEEKTWLSSFIGTAKGCLFAVDYHPQHNYVWDEDGLWVGNMFEHISEEMQNADWGTFTRWACGEQFKGRIYEVEDNSTPGLVKGDVLFFASGDNSCPVYRISGFDRFVKMEIPVTVENGKIIRQGTVLR